MVRFIIYRIQYDNHILNAFTFQYGQIYYLHLARPNLLPVQHLHSNMVRFIMIIFLLHQIYRQKFTFQYGQIYYDIQLFMKRLRKEYLHSNMVRFIIFNQSVINWAFLKFTFQYGQIYYANRQRILCIMRRIYIPIWLDLLLNDSNFRAQLKSDLHSNMVRFII